MPKFKAGKQITANEAFIMSMGHKAGNLKGRASAPKPVHKTAKAGDPNRRGRGKMLTQGAPMKATMQKKMGTTQMGAVATQPAFRNENLSLGQVNTGFRTTPKGSGAVK